MTDWYYAIDGRQYGPVEHAELRELIRSDRLAPHDLVWRDGFVDWEVASGVDGLFESTAVETDVDVQPSELPPPADIRVPLLVSAIGNVIVAVVWGWTLWCAGLSVPLVVLAGFEFSLYCRSKVIPRKQLADETRRLAIFQMIIGVVNPVTLACGILLFIESGNLQRSPAAESEVFG